MPRSIGENLDKISAIIDAQIDLLEAESTEILDKREADVLVKYAELYMKLRRSDDDAAASMSQLSDEELAKLGIKTNASQP